MKEVSWDLMVTMSYYKAANSMKSNLVFIAASLPSELVRNKSDSKVRDEQRMTNRKPQRRAWW